MRWTIYISALVLFVSILFVLISPIALLGKVILSLTLGCALVVLLLAAHLGDIEKDVKRMRGEE